MKDSDVEILENGIPRRARLDLNTPEELLVRECVVAVENLGADPLLTDTVVLLLQAKEKLSDWIEKEKARA